MNDHMNGVDLGQQVKPMGRTPFDTGNRMLAEGPTEMTFATVQTQRGQRLAVTFRTHSTTFTAFFDRANGMAAGNKIVEESRGLTSLVLPTDVPPTFRGDMGPKGQT